MTDTFRLGKTGKFSQILSITTNPFNTLPVDLTDQTRVFATFKKPDGTDVNVDGELVDNSITASVLLDQLGDWTYTVSAEFSDGTIIESIKGWLFWVI